jgi:alginate O-acetyltransferase complex protein AlgI
LIKNEIRGTSALDTASLAFVAFGLAAAVISNLSRTSAWRSSVLMLASLVFLGFIIHQPILFVPLAGFLLLGFAGLKAIEHGWSKSIVWPVLTVIVVYIWLKKYTFLPEGSFLQFPYFTLGLSYIFFRVLHLQIEAGETREKKPINLGAYLLYTLNFTTFVSGPIQRYDEFARDQFAAEPIALEWSVIGRQVERIIRGFFKVNVAATLLLAFHQDALEQIVHIGPPGLKLSAAFRLSVLYPIYLYCNFSGYIDIVIALARLMRLRLPENFDRPFSASSVLEFWNQWHITLSNWLKTYVYSPLLLTLMRRFPLPELEPFLGVLCFFVTFFLIGVWHGRTSEFIVFGVLTGGGMSVNKLWQIALIRAMGRKGYKALAGSSAYEALARGLNFAWFALTLYWFWSSWSQIRAVFAGIGALQWLEVWAAIWLAAAIVLALWERLRAALLAITIFETPVFLSRYARVVYATALGFVALMMILLLNQPAPDIVYKAF